MEVQLKQRVYELEKEAIEIQEEINMVLFRLNNDNSMSTLKASNRQLKLLNKDLKRNNKELKKLLKLMKED